MQDKGLGVTFEYTAQNTPQQNGKVKRTFATLYSRMRAMMEAAGFEYDRQLELWRKAASTATKLSNIMVTKSTEKSHHKRFFGIKPKIVDNLRTFGDLLVVTANPGPTIKGKIEDRGILCVFLGYAAGHDGKTYRMLNLKTRKVLLTRDVKWLHKFYAQKKNTVSQVYS